MAQSTPPDPILIIGAGVAGLILAQGLRLRSIPFRLFERHPQSYRAQGHRFRISKEAQIALDSVLSPQLQGLLRQTAPARNRFEPRYVDARRLDFPKPTPAGPESMPVDRTWIRFLTTLDIDDAIEFEKEFVSYELQDDRVRVNFSDGSTARGLLLVGADGIKSRVRKQRQPARKLLDLERWIMWGRTPLTDSLKNDLPQDFLSWCMYLDHEANVQTVVEPMMWPKSVQQESKSRLPDLSDYIYWVICTAPFQYAEFSPKTVEQKRLFLERVAERWHPSLKHLLSAASHELSACVPVLSSKPDIELCSTTRTERVTLVGDAAHAMSPMGGSGGDTAVRNAADLARTIAEEGVTANSIADFEVRMESRAEDKIEHSFRGGQKFWRGKEWTEYGEIDL
ncbi:FAD/NAD(P)-binding domain-containing protein [Zopfia rhizophila CBS 207.26]|uniref:FAD/NAD(P)-binding domain-containing protein n=1 Tax=Zopfia rhizophila CBS 207.26 TaxID=1314779 RepID=A0A6A6E1J6_9PEZI|nr:FAD/NAD(P)-binding domain-containing protein [Zopfia rhizophila CBS 207.26]